MRRYEEYEAIGDLFCIWIVLEILDWALRVLIPVGLTLLAFLVIEGMVREVFSGEPKYKFSGTLGGRLLFIAKIFIRRFPDGCLEIHSESNTTIAVCMWIRLICNFVGIILMRLLEFAIGLLIIPFSMVGERIKNAPVISNGQGEAIDQ